MNLTGVPNYQREVGVMRNPTQSHDVLNKLVFIYPFGIDQSIMNLPFVTATKGDADTIGDAMRSFFSISILKEIFTSNVLNLVKTASTYQRNKKIQDKSTTLINNLLRGNTRDTYGYSYPPGYEPNDIDSAELQSKVNQKFEQIKQSLRVDQRLKKLLPFMQVITLQNLLDVPVITGTAPFQLDSAALFALLSTAITTRTKLDDWGGVRKLTRKLQSMPDATVDQMIDILNKAESIDPPKDLDRDLYSRELIQLTNRLNQTNDAGIQRRIQAQINDLKNRYSSNFIANLKDNKMKELERNLMLMMDPKTLSVRYGLSNDVAQASYVAKKVSPQTNLLFDRTHQQFVDSLAGLDPIFLSFYMALSPIEATDTSWNTDYLTLKNNFVNKLMETFDTFMGQLKEHFDKKISANIEESSLTVAAMTKSCDNAREDFSATMNLINREISGNQLSPSFSRSELERFSSVVDKITSIITSVQLNTEKSLIQFLGRDTATAVFTSIGTLINDAIDVFVRKFNRTGDPTNKMQARLFAAFEKDIDQDLGQFQMLLQRTHRAFLTTVTESMKIICTTMFLLIFKLNLCEFVEVADVEFGIAQSDVLDLPNYCLSIPIEVAQALFMIYTTKNWKNAAISKGAGGWNPLNMSYIKGIVKLLRLQLGIPNLMVFDRQKNELYYSFQYMGAITEKIKLPALDIFVKHHLQDKSTGVSQVYY